MQRILEFKYLFIIILIGGLLRFISLNYVPPSLNWDEISHGYNAYSILKTSKDQWGQFLPIVNFRAYGDYPLPLNLYLTIPFILFFGLNDVAIRLPHALLGTLTIISVYFLVYGITKNKKIGLIASFLSAIEPWFLFPSRAVFQSNLSVFFLISGFAAFFNRDKNKWLLPISHLFLGLTLYSYHSTRIFTPLLMVILVLIYRKEFVNHIRKIFKDNSILLSFILFFIFFIPLPFIFLSPESRARSSVVFILDNAAISKIENLQNISNSPFKRILYNKVTYFVESFTSNYIEYFSPKFLFIDGGTQYQFSVPNHGVLYLFSLPLFYFGLLLALLDVFKYKNKNYAFLLLWLLLAPIPASITQDKNAVIRATTMLPIPEIFIGISLYWIINKFKKYEFAVGCLFILLSLISLENYLNIYAGSYRNKYSWSWQYGYKEVASFTKQNYDRYDQILFTKAYGEPHEFLLFYLQYDPQKYLNGDKITFYQSSWYWVDKFDKFWFLNDWQIKDLVTESKQKIDCLNKSCLLITTPNNAPDNFTKIDEVKFLDGKVAFEMYSNYFTNQ